MHRLGPLAARLGAVLAVLVLAVWLARPGDEAGAPGIRVPSLVVILPAA